MPQYICTVTATSNTVVTQADAFIELLAPANISVKIKRWRVCFGDGTQTVTADNSWEANTEFGTTANATGVAGTIVKKNANSPAAQSTVKVKNGTANFFGGNTQTNVWFDARDEAGSRLYEWTPQNDWEIWVLKPGGYFALYILSAVVSQKFTASLEWFE